MIARRHFIFPINLLRPRGESLSVFPFSLSLSLFSYSFHVTLPRARCSSTPLMHRSASIPLARALWTREQIGIKGESANGRLYIESPDPETKARTYERRERDSWMISGSTVMPVDLVASGAESGLKDPIRWLDDWLITFDLLAGVKGILSSSIVVSRNSLSGKFEHWKTWKIISREFHIFDSFAGWNRPGSAGISNFWSVYNDRWKEVYNRDAEC